MGLDANRRIGASGSARSGYSLVMSFLSALEICSHTKDENAAMIQQFCDLAKTCLGFINLQERRNVP